jgi:hypothetical protein
MDLRAGMVDVEKRKFLNLLGLELRFLGRPARSQKTALFIVTAVKTSNLTSN